MLLGKLRAAAVDIEQARDCGYPLGRAGCFRPSFEQIGGRSFGRSGGLGYNTERILSWRAGDHDGCGQSALARPFVAGGRP